MPVIISKSERVCRPISLDLLRNRLGSLMGSYGARNSDVSLVLLDDKEMAEYNEQYRHRASSTNVLSFPVELPLEVGMGGDGVEDLGDILISVETAAWEAVDMSISLHDRLTQLIIHGFLHLMGFDHERSEEEAQIMWDKEQQIFHDIKNVRRESMIQLAINVDHVATVRQARGVSEPDPVVAAGICELAGASGIVVHLREDRRHIQDRDVRVLRETVKTKLNLEMAMSDEIIDIALDIKPDMITLVPEKREELTTEGGLNVVDQKNKVRKTIAKMFKAGIPVSLFVDPEEKQIKMAAELGATFVELHTGRYCDALTGKERDEEFELIERAAELAFESGLRVYAGHGLDYRNVGRIAALETIEELSIGHSVISRAVYVGLDQAVREMLDQVTLHSLGQ
ncbi:MAG: pyridoxine 5'-phosphate synthase [Desulfobulbaceae bacterium]|nr:pyridoxine 5'-phosphate synthase [Desulfobulbaceae bacterium]